MQLLQTHSQNPGQKQVQTLAGRHAFLSLLLCALGFLSGCSTIVVPQSPQLETAHPIAVVPLRNLSQTPLAGEKAEQTLLTLLLQRQLRTQSPPHRQGQNLTALLDTTAAEAQIQSWLAQNHFDYVLSGSVNEWGYSKGIAGDPSVSITLWITPANQPDQMLWRATGSRIGFGYKNVAALAQDVMVELLEGVNIAQ